MNGYDAARVQAVVSRLMGEVWYRDTRTRLSDVLSLPYTVFTDAETYHYVQADGVRGSAHQWNSDMSYSQDNVFERCPAPTFPLLPDVWDYETNHWRQP
jgi:hypothetical protein